MGDSAEDRRKAKEEYLKSLADIKANNVNSNNSYIGSSAPTISLENRSGIDRREKLMEEKRREFFAKQSAINNSSNNHEPDVNIFSNGKPSNYNKIEYNINNNINSTDHIDSINRNNLFTSENNKRIEIKPSDHLVAIDNSNSEVKLSEWKSKGYPSEYAYAKDVGLLNIKVPPIQTSTKGINSIGESEQNKFKQQKQQDYAKELQRQIQYQNKPLSAELGPLGLAGHSNPIDITVPWEANNDSRQQKQMEYAKELQVQEYI